MSEVYLFSDLHLGGVPPDAASPDDRGFRICAHGADLATFIARARRQDGAG